MITLPHSNLKDVIILRLTGQPSHFHTTQCGRQSFRRFSKGTSIDCRRLRKASIEQNSVPHGARIHDRQGSRRWTTRDRISTRDMDVAISRSACEFVIAMQMPSDDSDNCGTYAATFAGSSAAFGVGEPASSETTCGLWHAFRKPWKLDFRLLDYRLQHPDVTGYLIIDINDTFPRHDNNDAARLCYECSRQTLHSQPTLTPPPLSHKLLPPLSLANCQHLVSTSKHNSKTSPIAFVFSTDHDYHRSKRPLGLEICRNY